HDMPRRGRRRDRLLHAGDVTGAIVGARLAGDLRGATTPHTTQPAAVAGETGSYMRGTSRAGLQEPVLRATSAPQRPTRHAAPRSPARPAPALGVRRGACVRGAQT